MGLLAFLVDIVLQRLNSFKFGAVRSVVSNHGGFWAPYMVWLCFTMGYAALSAYLVTSFAPLGAGSGIPEIKTYLNGVHIKGKLTAGLCTGPPLDCTLPPLLSAPPPSLPSPPLLSSPPLAFPPLPSPPLLSSPSPPLPSPPSPLQPVHPCLKGLHVLLPGGPAAEANPLLLRSPQLPAIVYNPLL